MNEKKCCGAKEVFSALLNGENLQSYSGKVKMNLKDGFLTIIGGANKTVLFMDEDYFAIPNLHHGGEYLTRSGAQVLLFKAPKKLNLPWIGVICHSNSVEAVLYLGNGRIYVNENNPYDIVSEYIDK